MGLQRYGTVLLAAALLAGCGQGATETTTEGTGSAVGGPGLSEADLALEASERGPCEAIDGVVIDANLAMSALRDVSPELTWDLVIGQHDLADESGGDVSLLIQTLAYEFEAISSDVRGGRIADLANGADTAPLELEVANLPARYWPDEGPVLVGHDGKTVKSAVAVYPNGLAFIGYCQGNLSQIWNDGAADAGFESPLEALDLLLVDSWSPRLDPLFESKRTDSADGEVAWLDRDPVDRTYSDAPPEVLAELVPVMVTVLFPEPWGSDQASALCSRTPDALNVECVGFTAAGWFTDGTWGWNHQMPTVPGEALVLVLLDEHGERVDLITLQSELLDSVRAAHDSENSIVVDFRPLESASPSPSDAAGFVDIAKTSIAPTPQREVMPSGGKGP